MVVVVVVVVVSGCSGGVGVGAGRVKTGRYMFFSWFVLVVVARVSWLIELSVVLLFV